jgi:hypothetical protein
MRPFTLTGPSSPASLRNMERMPVTTAPARCPLFTRFPPPWSIEESQESFIVKDANGQQLAYLYFENEPQRQMPTKRLSRDEDSLSR